MPAAIFFSKELSSPSIYTQNLRRSSNPEFFTNYWVFTLSYEGSVGQPGLFVQLDELISWGAVSVREGTKSPRDLTELHRSRVETDKVWGWRPPMQLKTGHNGRVHWWKSPLRQQIVFLLFIIILLKSQILGMGCPHERVSGDLWVTWGFTIKTSEFFLCLLKMSADVCVSKGGETERGCCLLLLLCLRCSGGARTPRRLMEPPRVAKPGAHVNVWFGLGRLRTDGMWQCREVNSIRDGEKSERKGEKEGRDAPSRRPWMIWKPEEQKNRSRWPLYPLSFALAPPEKLPLKHMFRQKKACEQKRAHAWNTRRHTDIPCHPLKGARFHLDRAEAIVCYLFPRCSVTSTIWDIWYSPILILASAKKDSCLAKGIEQSQKGKKNKLKY